MERRVIYAILLMLVVAVAPSLIWPSKRPAGTRPGAQAAGDSGGRSPAPEPGRAAVPPTEPRDRLTTPTAPTAQAADTVWVTSPLYRLGFSTKGGVLVVAELPGYQSLAPGDSARPAQLVPPGRPLLTHRLVQEADTVSLADWTFTPSAHQLRIEAGGSAGRLDFTARRGAAEVALTYRFEAADYRFTVDGQVTGLGPQGALLLVGLGDGVRSVQADSADDYRRYAVVTKAARTESRPFSSLDPGERAEFNGPFEWVAIKSKYFLVAALAIEPNRPQFGGVIAVGGPKPGKAHTRVAVTLTLPVPPAGGFRYQVYAGPFEHRRLAAIGHDLDDANPYGWIFRPIVQPVSVFVVNIVLWMHERLSLAYGWVLVIFGILVRLLLWPLNQKAMESAIRMQAVAPLIKETQERYKKEPERLQREMLRIYKEHKVNPFGGCVPMLIPLPVLLALFFVFDNTIAFRGVPFLWLPDLARPDPYYIIPLVMGLSMYALTKVGQMGVPPNPQTKMMLYFMPIMMTALFVNFASGLNLYYAVSNIFSVPQQLLIAQRRLRQAPVPKPATG
ncbi:MAG: membrane protein insertase YidC [Gemmatimonadales bacterium]